MAARAAGTTKTRSNSTGRYAGNQSYTGKNENFAYIYGNLAVVPDIKRDLEEPRRQLSEETRKNREKARHMSFGYVLFLAVGLCAAGIVLINYLKMQSELTNTTRHIAALESQLMNLQMSNDEEYNRIINSIDLEEIKRVAIGELGMAYAKEGQVISYQNAGNDYMRKVE